MVDHGGAAIEVSRKSGELTSELKMGITDESLGISMQLRSRRAMESSILCARLIGAPKLARPLIQDSRRMPGTDPTSYD